METELYVSLMLIGIGAATAGAVGIALPAGERLTAALALVIGAGVGVAALAVGYLIAGAHVDDGITQFLISSIIGLAAVLGSLAVLWRRSRRDDAREPRA
jgi:hypothetical protein